MNNLRQLILKVDQVNEKIRNITNLIDVASLDGEFSILHSFAGKADIDKGVIVVALKTQLNLLKQSIHSEVETLAAVEMDVRALMGSK